MIGKIVLFILIFLFVDAYMLLGVNIFYLAVNEMGGKATYIDEIANGSNNRKGAELIYYAVFVSVMFGWPFFLLSNALKRR